MKISIDAVKVASRHRRDLGDIKSLADSMAELGQLQPVILTPDSRLIAGERRLAAARHLGWHEIEANVIDTLTDAASLLKAERDENTQRKAFTPTEEHSLYEALIELERPEREANSAANLRRGSESPTGKVSASGRTKESVSEIVSGRAGRYKSLDKIGEVKELASDQSQPEPVREKARQALTEMDRDGNIDGAYKGVKMAQRAAEARSSTDFDSWSDDERALLKQIRDGETVVVSFREHHRNLVRWAQAEGILISVDRRTEWGNPFEMPHDGDRETVIANYRDHYLPFKPSLCDRLGELRGKALACWCAPQPCHADILKAAVDDDS